MSDCHVLPASSRTCESGTKGCVIVHTAIEDEADTLRAEHAEVCADRVRLIRDLARVKAELEEARVFSQGVLNGQKLLREGRCIGTIGDGFVSCGEGGNYCSAACRCKAERDAARWADETRQKACHAALRQRDEAIADRDEWRKQHDNALACWDVDRRNLASKVAATESRLVNVIIERDSALQSLAQQDTDLATMTTRATAAELECEKWRNCFICLECGRGAADEDGCCTTCGRDCLIFADGRLITNTYADVFEATVRRDTALAIAAHLYAKAREYGEKFRQAKARDDQATMDEYGWAESYADGFAHDIRQGAWRPTGGEGSK